MKRNTGTFRKRLTGGDLLIGTFIKTPSPIVAEVLSLSDLDVFCIDTEHAPFGRLETDLCISAFRAADRPSLVRIASDSPTEIRCALDSGATGILVPHVTSAEQAEAIVKAAHFGEGGRGYAGSSRAAKYTTKSMADHIADSNEQTTVVVQIEDIAALEHVAQIAAVEGIDALFVGRFDLAVAMKKDPSDAEVIATVRDICAAGQSVGTAVGMFTSNPDEITDWREAGASLFLLSSDQSMLLAGANALAHAIR
ncbi:MAG: aldolase/citrate lyase family protein [Gammaproteobacteria bacterium]|nr:aldolase/citrate lyase family protein [Gammaproteobacteria bacterium]